MRLSARVVISGMIALSIMILYCINYQNSLNQIRYISVSIIIPYIYQFKVNVNVLTRIINVMVILRLTHFIFTPLAGKQPFGVLLIRQLCGDDDDDDDGDICDCVGNQISLYCLIDNA